MTGIATIGTGMWGPPLAGVAERFGCEPAASLAEAMRHLETHAEAVT
jgi:hypothetical protein